MFEERVKTTISCQDCLYIPKVKNAGSIVDDKYQIMHNGVKVIKGGYHGQWMEKIIKELKGHHEPQEEKAFHEVLKTIPNNATMIELGSNWSYYSMWFNSQIENSKNIMIEPNEKKLDLGKENFQANNMSGIFIHACVGKHSQKKHEFVDWDGKRSNIKKVCIDDIIDEYDLSKVDILHSDIQGAEYNMLLGSMEAIKKKKIKYFFISTHGDNVHNNCTQLLTENNYKIICSHTVRESYSADGLIVASIDSDEKISISKRGKVR